MPLRDLCYLQLPRRGRASDSGGVLDRVVSQVLSEMDDLPPKVSTAYTFLQYGRLRGSYAGRGGPPPSRRTAGMPTVVFRYSSLGLPTALSCSTGPHCGRDAWIAACTWGYRRIRGLCCAF